jgi:hypothetical protein
MDLLNNWAPFKNQDYYFIDESIREYFDIGGVSVFLHKYLGPIDQGNQNDPTQPGLSQTPKTGVTEVQDVLFQENRDRAYDPYVYELKAVFNMLDSEWDIRQFGMFLESDTYFLSFHLNDVVEKIGRKLMPGDVLEMLHMRDDALLDENAPAINKFYQITDVNRASIGWSVTWRPHILRVKITPLTDSQQFNQILNMPLSEQVGGDGLDGTGVPGHAGSLGIDSTSGTGGDVVDPSTGGAGSVGGAGATGVGSLISDYQNKLAMSQAIEQEAENIVPYRNFNASHIWIVPGTERGKEYPWIFTGDGIPPNGSTPARSGTHFPADAQEGDYFLKLPPARSEVDVDRGMAMLFQLRNGLWLFQEVDLRLKWQSAHRILESFLNNNNITHIQDKTFPEKQPLSRAVLPKADY